MATSQQEQDEHDAQRQSEIGEIEKEQGECSNVEIETTAEQFPNQPYQPDDVSCIQVQTLQNRKLKFQHKWFKDFPWLHCDQSIGGVLCHCCTSASRQNLTQLARCSDEAFVSKGFRNWKKSTEKFRQHEKSTTHKLASENLKFRRIQTDTNVQLDSRLREEQHTARSALLKIITSLQFLAQQGLAIRGKDALDGNFQKLLQLRADDDDNLKRWLTRKTTFTGGDIQNEILQLMGHAVLRDICSDVNKMSTQFGIIIDGTQDIQGNEQESVCVRYVDDSFVVQEEMLGLYQVSSTTGESLSKMLQDALIRLQLPIEHLRAQTYDGASNMSGKYKGCQAEIKKIQPMASYFHCGAHVTHLITSKALQTAPYIRNALGYVQELGNLYNSSGKFKHLYLNLHSADTDNPSPTRLKPICPTRWLTHSAAVKSVLQNFEAVLDALHEAAEDFGTNTSSRASGLHSCLSSGKCILGLFTALPVIQCLEHFNRALQGTDKTVSGMLDAAEVTRRNLLTLRCDQQFREVFEATEQLLIQCNLEPVTLPRKRKLPKRHDDGATQEYTANSAEELCRVDFFKVIDSAISNLKDYFTSTDLILYKDLSDVLLTGSVQPHTIRKYPELTDSLQQQLAFFRNQFSGSSVEDYRKIFLAMVPEVRRMFPQVEQLLRLLLISPASSCVA